MQSATRGHAIMAVALLVALASSTGRPLQAVAETERVAVAAQPAGPVAELVANIRPDTTGVLSSRPSDLAVFQK